MKKVELLAPAGDLEKLKTAIDFGADAVYLGGESFGLRKASKNFSLEAIEEGVKYVHHHGKKIHVTMNIIPHERDLEGIDAYVKSLWEIGVDAVIVADPGMFRRIKRAAPKLPIHISTQGSVTNFDTVDFWKSQGAERVVLARELSLQEIKVLIEKTKGDPEIETFIHGAMCMSYSGRCLLSNYMTGRDANLGDCAQPCRYKYYLMEEKRPGQFFPIEEHEEGTFLMNSKDLCMIEHIDDMIPLGISSFKIEGRVKSAYYLATVVRSYRNAIDEYYNDPDQYSFDPYWLEEIKKVSHRDFTTGFFYKKPSSDAHVYGTSSYIRGYDFVGRILEYDSETKVAKIEQRNRLFPGDTVEIFGTYGKHRNQIIGKCWDEKGNNLEVINQAKQIFYTKLDEPGNPGDFLRRENVEENHG
ncbi:MAG: U32 family peptidase [Tissierellia bacterium]|nr:U32 family peptidase [Tissierellia bacterium]